MIQVHENLISFFNNIERNCFAKTRIHSSGMRTARLLPVSPSTLLPGVDLPGGCTCPGGVPAGGVPAGVFLPGGVPAQGGCTCPVTPTPVNRMTDRQV